MRIGELAEATGITTRALRYYEEQGLLTSRRTPAGYRAYDEPAARRVRNIRELLAIGFTIADVREFLGYLDRELPTVFADGGSCGTAMLVAQRRLAALSMRVDTLTTLRDQLAARLEPMP
jgi:MerR family copper efflux transcriptional regulator